MSNNDQFKMTRIPIRPLPYLEKSLAQTRELIIDCTGNDPTYHLYITDANDRTKIYDLTQLILNELISPITNADKFKISIEGLADASYLKDIINFIYKRFLMPDNANGFDYNEDWDKLYDPLTKSVLIKDTDGIIYLPVTTADNVFDNNGTSIQDRLDNITRVGFATGCVRANTIEQTSFEIEYPFPDYSAGGNHIELRIGSTIIDKARYQIVDNISSDGHVYTATLTLIGESLEIGRAINILYIYNSADTSNGKNQYLYGGLIANKSIPYSKLEKVSDRFDLDDSSSIATNKALYNLYKLCCEILGMDIQTQQPLTNSFKISTQRHFETITSDGQTIISYDGLNFITNDEDNINIYKNGVKLFNSIDFSFDKANKSISVESHVRTEKYDKFVFEYNMVERRDN